MCAPFKHLNVNVSVRLSQLFHIWSSSVKHLNMSSSVSTIRHNIFQEPVKRSDKTVKFFTKLCSGQICFLDQFLLHQPQCLSVSVFVCHSIPSLQPSNSSNISLDMGKQLNDRCWMIPSDKWMTTATTTNIIFCVSFFSYIYICFKEKKVIFHFQCK